MLEVNDLCFSYKNKTVLTDINIGIKNSEIVCLLGSNGAGKTTLLKCINNILKPSSGSVLIEGRDTNTYSRKELARIFSYVPQSYNTTFPITVMDMVMLGRSFNIKFRVSEEDKDIVIKILGDMNLIDLAFKDINELSGGERQRVLIAKAIAQESKILLLDEPTSSLDMKNQLDVLNTIEKLSREKDITIIMSIHDLNLALMYGDKFIMVKDSKIYDIGDMEKVVNVENIKNVYEIETIIREVEDYNRVLLKKHARD